MTKQFTTETVTIGGRTITFEVGRLAPQATSSVLVSCGETMVLATVVAAKPRADLDYFPLSVEYAERLYAGGIIKGSRWVKREGKPSDEAVLAGRIIDRSIRPLFPKTYKNEVQVIVTLLSVDEENAPDMLGLLAVSCALSISPIPWNGPIGGIRLGLTQQDGESNFIVNPSASEHKESLLNLVVAASDKRVVMIEADAQEIPEDIMFEAIKTAQDEIKPVFAAIDQLVKKVGQKKQEVPVDEHAEKIRAAITKSYHKELTTLADNRLDKTAYQDMQAVLAEKICADLADEEISNGKVADILNTMVAKIIRKNVLTNKKRVDGRKLDELRTITASVGLLPRAHGSAVFARGITQALTVATLGAPSLEQIIESPTGEERKRYMHHYNMPPYSVGEAGRFGFPKRREIGHGALAERALIAVLPTLDEFPYAIRLVSEIMSSNGSTSMASVCGSTLALMDAGVPIKTPVAGISVGLVEEGDTYQLLTDIIGVEDFTGDMDFKVAGTKTGVTAIQLDVKNSGLTSEMIEGSFERAHTARMKILEIMASAIDTPREKVSEHAPKIQVVHIPTEKIGEVIGPGGKIIRRIIAETGATVDVEDDGSVTISGIDAQAVAKAVQWVTDLTREVTAGEEFDGTVTRLVSFGMFVEVLPGKEGLVHVSQMSTGFIDNPSDFFKEGQSVKVKVREIDDQGRINLTLIDKVAGKEGGPQQPRNNWQGGNNRSGNRRGRDFGPRRR